MNRRWFLAVLFAASLVTETQVQPARARARADRQRGTVLMTSMILLLSVWMRENLKQGKTPVVLIAWAENYPIFGGISGMIFVRGKGFVLETMGDTRSLDPELT